MHPVLADMIGRFRLAQDRGVAVVRDVLGPAFGVRLPATNREWINICGKCGLYQVRQHDGIGIYAHGYGIELVLGARTIDFDWGDSGEPDGFDAWRLWNYVQVNRIPVDCQSYSQVQSWLKEAAALGELVQDELLYYSPAHRARSSERQSRKGISREGEAPAEPFSSESMARQEPRPPTSETGSK